VLANVGHWAPRDTNAGAYVGARGPLWIRDAAGLAALRRELRERIESSPVMDARQFARDVEAAFRVGWRRGAANTTTAVRRE
jgi:predicted O-linked N-acetylglucosamine transferase (SPINDLY family)